MNPSGRDNLFSGGGPQQYVMLLAHPPYNEEWERRHQSALQDAQRLAAVAKLCDWEAFPLTMEAPTTFQVVITPEETLMIFDRGAVRHIHTDGRSHPGKDDLWPTSTGHSIGHWEKDELVIDTIALTPGPVAPGPSANLSEKAHFTERLRMIDKDTLEDRMSIEDPLRFTKPWEVIIRYSRVVGLDRLIDYDCENDRNPVVDGKLIVTPP